MKSKLRILSYKISILTLEDFMIAESRGDVDKKAKLRKMQNGKRTD